MTLINEKLTACSFHLYSTELLQTIFKISLQYIGKITRSLIPEESCQWDLKYLSSVMGLSRALRSIAVLV